MNARHLASWCLLIASLAGARHARAEGATLVEAAKWQQRDGKLMLVIPLSSALTTKQRSMIDGGFTTVSMLTLRLSNGAPGAREVDEDSLPTIYGVRCSVKFNTWEDVYDVGRLDDARPRSATLKTFAQYGDLCFIAELDKPEILTQLAARGGTIYAHLIVKQTSTEEAEKIKDWLIQQQSGVMQSLFSHMLGELSLNQTARVQVSVPPKPDIVERAETADAAKRNG